MNNCHIVWISAMLLAVECSGVAAQKPSPAVAQMNRFGTNPVAAKMNAELKSKDILLSPDARKLILLLNPTLDTTSQRPDTLNIRSPKLPVISDEQLSQIQAENVRDNQLNQKLVSKLSTEVGYSYDGLEEIYKKMATGSSGDPSNEEKTIFCMETLKKLQKKKLDAISNSTLTLIGAYIHDVNLNIFRDAKGTFDETLDKAFKDFLELDTAIIKELPDSTKAFQSREKTAQNAIFIVYRRGMNPNDPADINNSDLKSRYKISLAPPQLVSSMGYRELSTLANTAIGSVSLGVYLLKVELDGKLICTKKIDMRMEQMKSSLLWIPIDISR